MVRFQLRRGVDVNWQKSNVFDSRSGLHFAAQHNNGEVLELLLAQNGVNVNIRATKKKVTPFMMACIYGHEDIMRRLSQVSGIQIGIAVLLCAVASKKPGCVSVLRGVDGVDWNGRNIHGVGPLTLAVGSGLADILQIILSVPEPQLDLSVTSPDGRNIAQIAVEENEGDNQRCLELLSADRRVDQYWNVKNPDGDSPVMFCLKTKRITMATTLLANPSVDLDTVDSEGRHLEDIARSAFNII